MMSNNSDKKWQVLKFGVTAVAVMVLAGVVGIVKPGHQTIKSVPKIVKPGH